MKKPQSKWEILEKANKIERKKEKLLENCEWCFVRCVDCVGHGKEKEHR